MTRDGINRMAKEAGMKASPAPGNKNALGTSVPLDWLERFAALVAAHEREACAKLCDEQQREPECPERATYCAAAIRARSQTTGAES